jgi:glycylpeptide N-tetradecanoyltransferase
MQHPKHDVLNAAYMYYYATDAGDAEQGTSSETASKAKLAARLNELATDLLIMAKQNNFDVLNALSLMDNNTFLQPLQVSST